MTDDISPDSAPADGALADGACADGACADGAFPDGQIPEVEDEGARNLSASAQPRDRIAGYSELRAYYRRLDRKDQVALCDWNIADLYTDLGEFAMADRYFAEASRGLAESELHHHQSELQWNRAIRLLDEAARDPQRGDTLTDEALDVAVASYIATDYERFQFTDPDDHAQRKAWEERADQRLAWILDVAYRLGKTHLLVDLIECGINTGVHTARSVAAQRDSDTDPAVDQSAASSLPNVATSARARPPALSDVSATKPGSNRGAGNVARAEELSVTFGAAARLLDDSHLVSEPPPALLCPVDSGPPRRLLADQRAVAADLDPDLKRILVSVPDVEIW